MARAARASVYLHDGVGAVGGACRVREPAHHRRRRGRAPAYASACADRAHARHDEAHAVAACRFAHCRAAAHHRRERRDARNSRHARSRESVGARDPSADCARRHVASAHLAVGRAFAQRSRPARNRADEDGGGGGMTNALSLFVTGTDTEIGKTLVSAALLRGFAREGLRAAAMKPIAAGASLVDGVLHNEDADQLDAAANVLLPPEIRTPFMLREPAAPHIAAALENVMLDMTRVVDAHNAALQMADVVVVEGVGGFRVPLTDAHETADLAFALNLHVVLVVGLRLGCISHALLTAEAIAARGLPLVGWVANRVDPHMTFPDENIASIREHFGREHDAPLLGIVPHLSPASPELAADQLDIHRLLQTLRHAQR